MGFSSFFHITPEMEKKAEELYNESVGIKPKKTLQYLRDYVDAEGYSDFPDQLIAQHLLQTFGTTDLNRVIKVAKIYKDVPGYGDFPDQLIAQHLLQTFGTTNLEYVFQECMTEETKDRIVSKIK